MKNLKSMISKIWLACLILACCPSVAVAQAITERMNENMVTVSGVVRDQNSRRKLEYVNVYVPGTNIGTVTNSDGAFTLKFKDPGGKVYLQFSYLGYSSNQVEVDRLASTGNEYFLSQSSYRLDEIVVSPVNARLLVEEAMWKVKQNYNPVPSLNYMFYRETVQKRNRYITISEAVTEAYKTAYSVGGGTARDRVRIKKSRSVASPDLKDTLSVKLEGGPNLVTFVDAVKNPDVLLDFEYMDMYEYSFKDFVTIDDRVQYAISFKPKPVMLDFPLYIGTIFIDRESLGVSRIEFSVDMADPDKVTRMMLRKKPASMRFRAQDLTYLVTYRYQGGRYFINYVRADFKFRCDWKRRLFATNYTVVSEMVVTNRVDNPLESITYRESFHNSDVLTDRIMDFYDEEFWEDYNIIEPTESLEEAVGKLRKAIDNSTK
ncbi:MAG: carboxypeptidase-like regulatory domain-containing protein [Bacteroidaceae bacterium]|nr:carboxypeptidase-like regulatory domain-containing protein [Bacteroidaceae bacterium]